MEDKKNDDIDYLVKQQNKFEEEADKALVEANSVYRDIVRQLILVATVILSISFFVFGNENVLSKLTLRDKHCFAFMLILLVLSIVFGMIQYIVDYKFFREWHLAKTAIADSIYTKEANEDNLPQICKAKQEKLPNDAGDTFVYLQMVSLAISMILLLVLAIRSIF